MSDEQTLFKGSPSPVIKLGTFLLCGLIMLAAVVFAFIVQPPYRYILLGLALISFVYVVAQWMAIKLRVYEVTSERIRVTEGLLTRRTDEIELYRVKDTTLLEPLLLRFFSVGDIELTTHDMSTPVIRLDAIPNARALREELRKSIEACRDKKRVRLAELE
jgi:uncharacterized membrane protein YdbT with pleckstrin-like domain